MRGTLLKVCTALALVATTVTAATAQDQRETAGPSLGISFGFTADPENFLLAFEAPFGVAPGVTVGPLLQLGLSDDWTIVAPSANVRYAFDLSAASTPEVRRLSPFIQGGLGFAYLDRDRSGRRDRDDTGFLFNMGGGIEYFVTEQFAVGSSIMFNVLPDSVIGENFFFSWQMGSARFLF